MKLIRTISSAMRGPWARAPSKCRVPQWRGRAQEREYVCLMSSTTGCAMSDSKTRGACWGPTEQSKCVAEKISIVFSWFALFLAFYARQAVRHFSQMKHCSIKPCWKQNTLFSTSMKFNPMKAKSHWPHSKSAQLLHFCCVFCSRCRAQTIRIIELWLWSQNHQNL